MLPDNFNNLLSLSLFLCLFVDLLITEFETRFSPEGIITLSLLSLMPVSVVKERSETAWTKTVKAAIKPYMAYLPSPPTLDTELLSWRQLL
jgi:hypothetical protein